MPMGTERVALVHGYLRDKKLDRPDKITRVSLLSAAEALRAGEIDEICITETGDYGETMGRHLGKILRSPASEEHINVIPEGKSTEEELKTFTAAYDGDIELISISNHEHTPRVKRIINGMAKQGDQDILVLDERDFMPGTQRYDGLLDDMENWPDQKSIARKEKILNTLSKVPHLEDVVVKTQLWLLKTFGSDNLQFQNKLLGLLGRQDN